MNTQTGLAADSQKTRPKQENKSADEPDKNATERVVPSLTAFWVLGAMFDGDERVTGS